MTALASTAAAAATPVKAASASLADLAKKPASSSSSGSNSKASPSSSSAAGAAASTSASEATKQQQLIFDAGGPDGALARVAVAIGVNDEKTNAAAAAAAAAASGGNGGGNGSGNGSGGFSSLRLGGLRRGVIIDAAADAATANADAVASSSLAAKTGSEGVPSQDALGPFPLLPETHPADAAARGMLTMAAGAAHGAKGFAGDVERGAAELAVNGPRAPPGADKKKRS